VKGSLYLVVIMDWVSRAGLAATGGRNSQLSAPGHRNALLCHHQDARLPLLINAFGGVPCKLGE
jgi:hypothetical protein